MDAGSLTARKRDLMVYTWYRDKALFGQPQSSPVTYDILIQKIVGSYPMIFNQNQIGQACCLPTTDSSSLQTSPPYTLDEAVFLALDGLMAYLASENLGPTKGSRIMYLWFHTIVSGYSWANETGAISGTKDNWNWDVHYSLSGVTEDIFLWMNGLLVSVMPTFVPGYDTSSLEYRATQALGWDSDRFNDETTRVQTTGNFSAWQTAWTTWYTARQSDGSIAAAAVPNNSVLPNGSQTMETTTTTDNPNTFTAPQKWVPLKINGTKKNYLTYTWGDVTSTILTASQETTLINDAQTYFPGTASTYDDNSTRANEIAEVVNITATLTDTQKMIAEFWAGGAFTISPPCMFILFWRYFMEATLIAHTRGFNAFFYSGLELAINIFETGRLVWQLKKNNMQARPIQEVRRMYRGQTLTKWDGTSILGEAWTPYQEINFVTPPFADFPSGHSAFSQSFANVMISWFGTTIPLNPITMTNLNLISPIFSGSQTAPLGTFSIPAKSSQIQTGVVPATSITLTYLTWQAMADDAGISRKYGGIHATSAHTGSKALANALYPILETAWGISKEA
jgi:membrane-associated phospholipid phosphatase